MKRADNENTGAGDLSPKNYTTGFILAVFLTIISFGLVLTDIASKRITAIGLLVTATLQILVHLHYFLHLDRSSAKRWNLIAITFTALLLFIFVAGTIWIMHTLNSRMM